MSDNVSKVSHWVAMLNQSESELILKLQAFWFAMKKRCGYLSLDACVEHIRLLGGEVADLEKIDERTYLSFDSAYSACMNLNERIKSCGSIDNGYDFTHEEHKLLIWIIELREYINSAMAKLKESFPITENNSDTGYVGGLSSLFNAAAGSAGAVQSGIDMSEYEIRYVSYDKLRLKSGNLDIKIGVDPGLNLHNVLRQMVRSVCTNTYPFDLKDFYDRILRENDKDHCRSWAYIEQLSSDHTEELVGKFDARILFVRFSGMGGDAVFVFVMDCLWCKPTLFFFPMSFIENKLATLSA